MVIASKAEQAGAVADEGLGDGPGEFPVVGHVTCDRF